MRIILAAIFAFTTLVGCNKGNSLPVIVTGNDVTMSPKVPLRGVITGNNLLRMSNTAVNKDWKDISSVFDTYTTNRNDLSYNGGMAADVAAYKATLAVTSAIAVAAVAEDAKKALSDPTRKIPTSLLLGTTALPNDAGPAAPLSSMASESVKIAVARAIVRNFTGVDGTEAEINSLVQAMNELYPLLTPGSAADKRLLCSMIVTMVLMGNSWHGG